MKHTLPIIALLGLSASALFATNIPATEDSYIAQPKNTFTGVTGKSPTLLVSPTARALVKFEIDGLGIPSSHVQRASLRFYVSSVKTTGEIEIRSLAEGSAGSWAEDAAKGVAGPALDPAAGAIVALTDKRKRFVIVDATDLVKLWLDDPSANNGVAIVSKNGVANIKLGSKEGFGTGYPAVLEIESNPALPLFSGGNPNSGTLNGANLLSGSVGSSQLGASAVTNSVLASDSVSTGKLADGSVTNPKLADGAVSAAKIAGASVGNSALVNSSVSTSKLVDESVTTFKLANGAVTGAKLSNNAVTSSILENDSVGTAKLADGAVTTSKLANNAVGIPALNDGSVITSKLADGAVTTAKMATSAVATFALADSSVTAAKLAAASVGTAALADSSVSTAKLADGGVTPLKNSPECAVFFEEYDENTNKASIAGWSARDLNNQNPILGSSISRAGNTITLQPGTYFIEAAAFAYGSYSNQLILRNVTGGNTGSPSDATAEIRGISSYVVVGGAASTSNLSGIITVSGSAKNYELWHFVGTGTAIYGFGIATNVNSNGGPITTVNNRYSQISIIRLK